MKEAILDILKRSHAPIKRGWLLGMLRARGIKTTDRAMRKAVEELIESGELIASSEKGYQIIEDENQVKEALEYLKKKSKSIAIRGNLLIHNYRKQHPESPLQLDLF